MKKIGVKDIDLLPFWINYVGGCYPNGYDEERDISVSELMQELYTEEIGEWWEKFTGYYEGVLEESDGYLDEPVTLEEAAAEGKILNIEFHPGDILYFMNGKQIGSAGPHWELQTIPYKEVEQLLAFPNGGQLFLLLLPLACIEEKEVEAVIDEVKKQMGNYFPESLCERVSRCIAAGLLPDED